MSLLAHEDLPRPKLEKQPKDQQEEPTTALILILMTGGWIIPVFAAIMLWEWINSFIKKQKINLNMEGE